MVGGYSKKWDKHVQRPRGTRWHSSKVCVCARTWGVEGDGGAGETGRVWVEGTFGLDLKCSGKK